MAPDTIKPRWWYWVIAVLGLLWNSGGAYDYIMTVTENQAYLSQIPQEALDYYLAFPAWMTAAHALAVWGAVLGWILMLMRSRYAVMAFIVSLAAMAVNFGYMAVTGGLGLQGTVGLIFTVVIVIVAILTVWYARKMRSKGILR